MQRQTGRGNLIDRCQSTASLAGCWRGNRSGLFVPPTVRNRVSARVLRKETRMKGLPPMSRLQSTRTRTIESHIRNGVCSPMSLGMLLQGPLGARLTRQARQRHAELQWTGLLSSAESCIQQTGRVGPVTGSNRLQEQSAPRSD
jgi:hypothetical protein